MRVPGEGLRQLKRRVCHWKGGLLAETECRMKNQTPFPERLQRAFAPTHRGVIGVVDDLLGLCREQGLELTWHADKCQVRPLGTESQEATEVPLPKSVFRAI